MVTTKILFTDLTGISKTTRMKKRKDKIEEEIECNDTTMEDDIEQPLEGITIATWGFAESNSA